MTRFRTLLLVALALCAPLPASGADGPTATVDAFQAALARGDARQAQALLASDVLVYESGGQEASREEYASHHLAADIEFTAGAKLEQLGRNETASGDLAVVTTRYRITGRHQGKPFDLFSTESMALKRTQGRWLIAHIHWSSRPATPAPR